MSALSIQPTYPIFTDIDGQPLEAGYIWIGTANLNPITNPINVYWDAALTQPAAQPIRTVSGYPSNAGTPARLYVNSDYSIQVQNKNATVVYSAPVATERYNQVVISSVNAEDVVYDPPYANAVQTNGELKFAESVSIKDFGAVGDGVTNDTTAIQNAIDAVFAAGGGTVNVPKGNYLIGVVNLKSNVSIMGVGEASKFTTSNPTVGAFTGSNVSNIEIAHIFIQGTNIVDPSDPQNGDTGVYLNTCTNIKIHHCHVDGVFAWGLISVNNSDQIDFSHNTITNIGNQSAIGCDNGTTNFIVANNQIKNGKLYGIEVEAYAVGNRWGVISGNIVENCVAGIAVVANSQDITIVGNVLRNNNNINTISGDFGYGVYVVGETGASTRFPARVIIDSNIIHTHSKYAILLNNKANEITISNNTISKGAVATQAQNISAVNDSKSFINIINNNIDCSNNSQAIQVDGTNRLRIEGNSAQNLHTSLITVGGSVTNAQIQTPYINSAEASTVTSGANINPSLSNWIYSNEWQEYTVESGSTTYEYLTAKRETRIVGIQWCINPQTVGGGPTDYWIVNIDGSDVNPNLFATTADRDNWAYTPLNTLLSAGSVIRVRILSGAGTAFNHYRYRLVAF